MALLRHTNNAVGGLPMASELSEQENAPASDENSPALGVAKYEWNVVWRNVLIFIVMHAAAVYGLYLFIFKVTWYTFFYSYNMTSVSGLGVTAGAHRLWAHRSYKARLPLRILLVLLNTMALQDPVIHWARDHRLHHKYSDTDADPYNSRRGFFYCHMGWLLIRKHPDVAAKGKTIDMSDLTNDPLLKLQERYYIPLAFFMCFVLPPSVATLWGESAWNAFFVCSMMRYVLVLHGTWSVNSVAHMWGDRPYDKTINPVENKLVSWLTNGEGFHNFHHTFPWDYKTGELGGYRLNFTKLFIDTMAAIGWAYDLKSVSGDVVQKRALRTGDGTRPT